LDCPLSTLFWAGKTYAPKLRVKDISSEQLINIQDFLQECFLNAFDQLVRVVGDCEGVVGFEVRRSLFHPQNTLEISFFV
jgi:hypothetical protein